MVAVHFPALCRASVTPWLLSATRCVWGASGLVLSAFNWQTDRQHQHVISHLIISYILMMLLWWNNGVCVCSIVLTGRQNRVSVLLHWCLHLCISIEIKHGSHHCSSLSPDCQSTPTLRPPSILHHSLLLLPADTKITSIMWCEQPVLSIVRHCITALYF